MAEYVTLIGAEDVRRAASEMQHAAETMRQVHSFTDDMLRRHQQFMDDWLARFQAVLEQHRPPAEPGTGDG